MAHGVIKTRESAPDKKAFAGVHPVLANILAARGIQSAQALDLSLTHLLSYETLAGLDVAVNRLIAALTANQRLMIIGDFDADGATSSALAVSALSAFGARHVDYIVPNRFEYGYGLTPEIVDVARSAQPDVIITVDNGISSIDGVNHANAHGIDVIITDHHLPGARLPDALAIINPNLPHCAFASGALAGVGVIFYVMCGLRAALRARGWFEDGTRTLPAMNQFLDLVALGTVADVVPLDRNNRILVAAGLRRMRAGCARVGLQALMAVAKREAQRLNASDCGFALGPRLNAAGRLTDMSIGIQLLLCEDYDKAYGLAMMLDELNQERRRIEQSMHAQAITSLNAARALLPTTANTPSTGPAGYCFYHKEWHQGVIGIVAGRLKERLHRPVIAFARADANDGMWLKGSARSIEGIHIRDVLDAMATQYPELLSKFGGHAMAAGLSLRASDLARFTTLFAEQVASSCTSEVFEPVTWTDGTLSKGELTLAFAHLLRDAGPWGQQFPVPQFQGRFKCLAQRLVGEKHLKMTLALAEPSPGGAATTLDAIAFNVDTARWPDYRCEWIDCVYQLDINYYKGVERLQLCVSALMPAEIAATLVAPV